VKKRCGEVYVSKTFVGLAPYRCPIRPVDTLKEEEEEACVL